MKILHIINSLQIGGAEKLLKDIIPLCIEKNAHIEVLVLKKEDNFLTDELKKFCKIHYLGTRQVYNPLYIFKIIPYLKNKDVVHVHLFPSMYFAVFAKLFSRLKVKLIFTEHSTSNRRLNRKFLKGVERWIYSKYNKVICITEAVKFSLIEKLNLDIKCLQVIENGVNISKVEKAAPSYRKNFNLNIDDFVITMVAGFRIEKDQETLLIALSKLPYDYKLLLVGDGFKKAKCMKLAEDLNLISRVQFLGIRSDAINIMKMSDVNILSSHWEGFGLVAIEGMAAGKPFIGTDVPGLRDVIKDAGLLFNQGDATGLADIIQSLKKDKILYKTVSNNCLIRSQKYDIGFMINKYIEMYDQIVRG